MTMYVAVELHDFVFFAADKRVTIRSESGESSFSDDVTKLNLASRGLVTGCGLESVIERVGSAMSQQGFTQIEKNQINLDYPKDWLNSTRVAIAPAGAAENQRLLWLNFGDHQKGKFFEPVGGLVDGCKSITDEHRNIVITASDDFVRNKLQEGAFERFLEEISRSFAAVASLSDEVSSVFDYVLQYPNGQRYFNTHPVSVVGT